MASQPNDWDNSNCMLKYKYVRMMLVTSRIPAYMVKYPKRHLQRKRFLHYVDLIALLHVSFRLLK